MSKTPTPTAQLLAGDVGPLIALARRLTGISLTERKGDFLVARLERRLAANGLRDFRGYRRLLETNAAERAAFAEALTTHTTSFYRERAQFDWLLSEGLPELDRAEHLRGRDFVIWSAACSTGQEGYTALMVANQARNTGLRNLRPRLIGTDISRPVLRQAAQAVYPREAVEDIPLDLRQRFLLSSRRGCGRVRIGPELRDQATWRRANLVTGEGLDGIVASLVLLRNVLIYFDEEARACALDNVVQRLRPGGFLLTGHTEAAYARRDGLQAVRPSIYRKATG